MGVISVIVVALRSSEVGAFAVQVLDALPSAVIVVAEEGGVVYANARACQVLDRRHDEVLGAQLSELMDLTPDSLRSADLLDLRHECRIRSRRGELVSAGYAAAPIGDGLIALAFRDISDAVRLQEERDRLLQLAAVAEAMPTLLHEVKNPLSAILTTVELLIEDTQPGPLQDSLFAILSEARRIGLQLDGVGAVGRSLSSQRAHAIDHACREVCSVMAARAERAGVRLRADIPTLPLLRIDPATIRAVLLNLVTNAIHACRPNDAIHVFLRLDPQRQELELGVVDTGAGMTQEAYESCTKLFYTTKRHGSGIGLALCHRAAEECGGRLEIVSVLDVGTAVSLFVPVAPRVADARTLTT